MRNSIIVNFFLTFAFLLILLHQWIGWEAEGHELKNKSLEFNKENCLKQLNVDGRKRIHPDTLCHKLYLRDADKKDEPAKPFNFCIPLYSKYLIVDPR